MLSTTLATSIFISAGILNGTYPVLSRKMPNWRFENIWFVFAIFCFVVLPWSILLLTDPNALLVYQNMSSHTGLLIFIFGVLFGIGQITLPIAFNLIGFGLSFLFNIGISTTLGGLVPIAILYPQQLFDAKIVFIIIASMIAIVGLILAYLAGIYRDKHAKPISHPRNTTTYQGLFGLGVILASITGLVSIGQNYSFLATQELQQIALQQHLTVLNANTIMWPLFFSFSFIPIALFMLYLNIKHQSFDNFRHKQSKKYFLYCFIMAAFWYLSMILYSEGVLEMGRTGALFGWPLFTTMIVLTSNFWGWLGGEWRDGNKHSKILWLSGISLLTLAIIILSTNL